MYSNFIWAVNRRPFQSGAFGDQKKELLNRFLETSSIDGVLFRKYMHKIAADFGGLPCNTREELELLWSCLPSLPSFEKAGEVHCILKLPHPLCHEVENRKRPMKPICKFGADSPLNNIA